tara:strand:+ start:3879 stop:5429 length:1551 start_codon:yes stop_codon:yes gene_type:complete
MDEVRLVHFSTISIDPFTHVKQEKLIHKWLEISNQNCHEDEKHNQIDQIEKNVNSIIIEEKILPRYPFFILSILQTHESFMPPDLKITAYGHCYYALILAHLIKSGIEKKDEHISMCFNYSAQLAHEIFKKAPKTLCLSTEDYNKFDKSYKDDFIIYQSNINRLFSPTGILKKVDGKGITFNLDYSYYFFLGMHLAKTYEKNKSTISKMIERSHKKNNALSLIFIIHHTEDIEIIDEILTHTLCSIDNVNPAKLDANETKVFNKLLVGLPNKLETNNTIDEEREEERKQRDIIESNNPTREVDEKDDHLSVLNQIYKCRKNIEILSQILKNKIGDLKKPKIYEIVETICDAGLRLARILLSDENEMREVVEYINAQYIESDDYDDSKSKRERLEDIDNLFRIRVFLWVMTSIEHVVTAISKPGIKEIIDNISEDKNTPAYEMINYFYSLDTATKFDEKNRDQLSSIINKYDRKKYFFLHKTLSLRTQHYLNTHAVKTPINQSVCSLLQIQYKKRLE